MKRTILTLALGALLGGSAQASTYSLNLTASQSKTWSDSTAWTPNGVPGSSDTVIITNQLPWASTWTLTLDTGWAANTINITSANAQMNDHTLTVTAGTIGTLNANLNDPISGNGFHWNQGNLNVTLTQWNNLGTRFGYWQLGTSSAWLFTNAAQITYYQQATNALTAQLDFSGATSINLLKSTAFGSTTVEVIQNTAGNMVPVVIGRADSGVQTWTVGTGSHPILQAYDGTQSKGFSKVGSGDVVMTNVDLKVLCVANHNIGISASGGQAGSGDALYGGVIYANSVQYTRLESATANNQRFDVIGNMLLSGQGGLQAGGTGNGRAFSLVSTTNGLTTCKIGSQSAGGNNGLSLAGHLTIAPAGGAFYLAAPQSGSVRFQLYSRPSDRTNATLTANTINLASPNVTINDRDPNNDVDANAGGAIEFRGDFISQCTDTNNFRLDSSTLRVIGGGTNVVQYWECMSKDNGAVSPSTNNFALGRLVLGQTSTGTTSTTKLVLRDQYTNNLASTAAEALYVTNLTMYATSVLYLNNLKLYYKNSGSWTLATPGAFTPGDGTGKIRAVWPETRGSMLEVY